METQSMPPGSASRWQAKLTDLFGIDPRTLALSRIAVAAVLLYNLADRAQDLRSMYSDDGLFPVADVIRWFGAETWRWSLHALHGSVTYQAVLFSVAAFFGVMLLIGFQSRLATIASWILLVSLHTRVPVLVTGGDVLLCMTLFWGMFLPWGQRCSVDAWRRGGPRRTAPVLSVASAAILLQIAFMYFFTAFSKCNFLWYEGRAIESVFLNPLFTRPLGHWLVSFPILLKSLTYGTLVLELIGPPLMFCPWKTRTVRSVIVLCFFGLHIGIELTMRVVIFSYASMAALTLFTPGTFWSLAWVRKLTAWFPSSDSGQPITDGVPRTAWHTTMGVVSSIACLVVAAHVAIVNPLVYFGGPQYIAKIPPPLDVMRQVLSLDQEWSMFACPAINNYRYVAVADLRDGTQIDVLRNEPFEGVDRPEELSMVLPSARWVQIVVDLGRSNRDIFRHSVIRYLARQWNASHDPERQIEHIQLAYIVERPDPDGHLNVDKLVIAKFDPFAKGAYRALQREDHWIHYYANGKKEAEGDYRKGLEQGTWTLWYEDGRKQGQGTYVAGQLHGKWTFWYDEGEKVEAFFDRGRLVPRPLARSNPVRQGGT